MLKKTVIALIALYVVAGCSHVENAANEGQQAFETGMRTKDSAKDFAAQKEGFDRQADEF